MGIPNSIFRFSWSVICLAAAGCVAPGSAPSPAGDAPGPDPIDDPTPADPDPSDDDDVQDPVEVPPLRFAAVGESRGLDVPMMPPRIGQEDQGGHANVVAQDLDDDGDIDIVLGMTTQGVAIFENDGDGHFTVHPGAVATGVDFPVGIAAIDLDDDHLPELVLSGFGWAAVATNLGDLEFGAPQRFLDVDSERLFGTFALGDLDGDHDLDLFLPVQVEEDVDLPSASHRLFLQEGGSFVDAPTLQLPAALIDSQVVTLADFDDDADLDVLMFGDQGPTSLIFRNAGAGADGMPVLEEVGSDLGFDLDVAAMGVDGADLNDDGVTDWCITDVGPPVCWLSTDEGFIESGLALGLIPEDWRSTDGTVGWSIDLADLDNDGLVDVVQASGPEEGSQAYPDLLWRNEAASGGRSFADVSVLAGAASEDDHYGLATADFDGDGSLDVVTAGSGGLPTLLLNDGNDLHWIAVDLRGPAGNSEGIGAHVSVYQADRIQTRPVQSLRGQGQGPSLAHFGLGGDSAPVTVKVAWPDGTETLAEGLDPDRKHWIEHPDSP